MKILIVHCTSLDDFTRLRALTWVNVFILVGKEKLLPYSALLLSGILPCLSHEIADIGMEKREEKRGRKGEVKEQGRREEGRKTNFNYRRGSVEGEHKSTGCIKLDPTSL